MFPGSLTLGFSCQHGVNIKLRPRVLSGGLGAGPAQREVVKMKKKNFPTELQVHLEDMF